VRAAASLPPPAPLLSTTTGRPGPARPAQPAASVATGTACPPPPPAAAVRSRPARPLPPPPPPVLPWPARPPPPLVADARPPPARPPPPPTGAACPGPALPPPPPAVAVRPGPAPAPRCSDHLFMTARGGLDLGGDHTELIPRGTISKNNVYGHDALGFSKADQRRLRRCVRFAIDDILGSARPLCLQDPESVRRAVVYLEERDHRLASCDASWGACALLSRSLNYRRQTETKRRKRLAVADAARGDDDSEGGAGAGGARTGGGAAGGEPTEQQRQEGFLAQLP